MVAVSDNITAYTNQGLKWKLCSLYLTYLHLRPYMLQLTPTRGRGERCLLPTPLAYTNQGLKWWLCSTLTIYKMIYTWIYISCYTLTNVYSYVYLWPNLECLIFYLEKFICTISRRHQPGVEVANPSLIHQLGVEVFSLELCCSLYYSLWLISPELLSSLRRP